MMFRKLVFFLSMVCTLEASALPIPANEAHSLIRQTPISHPATTDYDRGLQALQQNNLPAAEAAFRKALTSNTNSVPALLGLAEVAFKRKKLEDAGKLIKQAVAREPDNPFVQSSLGRYLTLSKHYDEAEAALIKAARLDPKSARNKVDLGDFYSTVVNKPREAQVAYEQATRADPSHAGAHYALGVTLTRQGENKKALPILEKAVQLAPSNPLPLVALGRAYAELGNLDKAFVEVDSALKIQPGLVSARELRGDLLASKNDSSAALKEYEILLRSQPKAASVLLKTGMLYQATGKYNEAMAAYKKTVAVDPRSALAYNNMAWLAASKKIDSSSAEKWAGKAVALAPNNGQFHDTLGWVYRKNGKLKESLTALQQASRLSPSDPSIQYHLGTALKESGKPELAREALNKALQLSSSFPEATEARQLLNSLEQRK